MKFILYGMVKLTDILLIGLFKISQVKEFDHSDQTNYCMPKVMKTNIFQAVLLFNVSSLYGRACIVVMLSLTTVDFYSQDTTVSTNRMRLQDICPTRLQAGHESEPYFDRGNHFIHAAAYLRDIEIIQRRGRTNERIFRNMNMLQIEPDSFQFTKCS